MSTVSLFLSILMLLESFVSQSLTGEIKIELRLSKMIGNRGSINTVLKFDHVAKKLLKNNWVTQFS